MSASITGEKRLPCKYKVVRMTGAAFDFDQVKLSCYTLIPDLDDVSVVELVLQGDDLPHEAQGTELVIPRSIYTNVNTASKMPGKSYLQEGVSGLDQDQDSPQQVLSIFACSL